MAEIGHSKYYYDYTRNMSTEQEKEFYKNPNCTTDTCEKQECDCCRGMEECPNEVCECFEVEESKNGFDAFLEVLAEEDEPCLIENGDCDNCDC